MKVDECRLANKLFNDIACIIIFQFYIGHRALRGKKMISFTDILMTSYGDALAQLLHSLCSNFLFLLKTLRQLLALCTRSDDRRIVTNVM